jgi:hypothetical protein
MVVGPTSAFAQDCDEDMDLTGIYFDPSFPTVSQFNLGDKTTDMRDYQIAMKRYAESHPPFPVYNNTGRSYEDQLAFEKEKDRWFVSNLYFPMLIMRTNSQDDLDQWELAKKEWAKRYPEKYKELFDMVYENSDLKEKYFDIITIK